MPATEPTLASSDMTPTDNHAARKARRQFGEHGHVTLAVRIVVVIACVKWVAQQIPGQ